MLRGVFEVSGEGHFDAELARARISEVVFIFSFMWSFLELWLAESTKSHRC